MKFVVLILAVPVVFFRANAQSVLKPRGLQVTVNKTTNLIFPAEISSVDRGSERIVVQKSMPNILRVKADTVFNDTTNLSVITSDGKLYSFLVSYLPSPEVLNLNLGAGNSITEDTALLAIAKSSLQMKGRLHGLFYAQGNVLLSVKGVYTNGKVVICCLRIENSSSLSFEPARLQCTVKSSGSGKRRPLQETAIQPLLVHTPVKRIREKQSAILAVVVPKAALGAGQVLQIDLSEKGGERHLSIAIPNKYILKATLLK